MSNVMSLEEIIQYQPFYNLDQQNMQELYIFWILAALMIIIPVVAVWIWSKKGDYKV